MTPERLEERLCKTFCGGISVNPVASGFAVSSLFEDDSGDRIAFYLSPTLDGFQIEDDGAYLAQLIAKDIRINEGTRGQMLEAILSRGNAYWDRDTFEIRTSPFPEDKIEERIIDFLSSMIRVRDLELLTRENVRSTFRDDVYEAMKRRLGNVAVIEQNEVVAKGYAEFPADFVVRPLDSNAKIGAVFVVSSNDKLNEALLLQTEAKIKGNLSFKTIAMIEEPELKMISRKKFQRAQNRGLPMPIFRGEEDEAIDMIARTLDLPVAA